MVMFWGGVRSVRVVHCTAARHHLAGESWVGDVSAKSGRFPLPQMPRRIATIDLARQARNFAFWEMSFPPCAYFFVSFDGH